MQRPLPYGMMKSWC